MRTYKEFLVDPVEVVLEHAKSFVLYKFPVDRTQDFVDRLAKELKIFFEIAGSKPVDRKTLAALQSNIKKFMFVRRYAGLQKIEGVMNFVKDIVENDSNAKVVLFMSTQDAMIRVHDDFRKPYGAVIFYPGSKPPRITERCRQFNTNKTARILITQPRSAIHKIPLKATHVVYGELDYCIDTTLASLSIVPPKAPATFIGLKGSVDQLISRFYFKHFNNKTKAPSKTLEAKESSSCRS